MLKYQLWTASHFVCAQFSWFTLTPAGHWLFKSYCDCARCTWYCILKKDLCYQIVICTLTMVARCLLFFNIDFASECVCFFFFPHFFFMILTLHASGLSEEACMCACVILCISSIDCTCPCSPFFTALQLTKHLSVMGSTAKLIWKNK